MKKVLICALLSFAWLLVSCGTPADNADVPKGGKEYEGAVWQAFWESASERFGVEYSDYKMAHTTYSFISENTTSDGYISYYYLIQTAYETRNAFGQEVLHKVTARCYYVPDYSKAVHTTYMTHDGEVVFFDEETEDWLLGIGALSSSPASVDNPKSTTTTDDTKKSATTKKKTTVTTTATTAKINNTEYLSTEDMNEFLVAYILPQYVTLNGTLHNAVEYDSGPQTEWCYKLTGQVGNDTYEALVYPFQLGKGNEITDLWIAYLKWNGNFVVHNDFSEQIDYSPKKYW